MIDVKDKAGIPLSCRGNLLVEAFPFKKQALRIEPEKIKKENDEAASDKEFEMAYRRIDQKIAAEKLWHGRFVMPLDFKDA